MLYGPGGIGKSSLLHAGVVHELRARALDVDPDDAAPRTDVVIVDDWTGDPLARIAAAIATVGGDPDPGGDVLAAIAAHRASRGGGLLLILDQFEDHLRSPPQRLDEILAQIVRDPSVPARILITVREDRLADLDRFGGNIPQLFGNMLRLGRLSADAALEAIEGPIAQYNAWVEAGRGGRRVTLEPGLAQAVRDGLTVTAPDDGAAGPRDEPGVDTSFLQLVMRRLWDEDIVAGGGAVITAATLQRLGGTGEIVANHLQTALTGLTPREEELAADVLRHLVTPSGVTVALTPRDLAEYTGHPPAEIEALAERLSRPPARILRPIAGRGLELAPVLARPTLDWIGRRRAVRAEARVRRLLLALVTMTVIAAAAVAYALHPRAIERLERHTVDARFSVRGTRAPDDRVVFVKIDDAAAAHMQARGHPRAVMARFLRTVAAADPAVVAVDVVYTGWHPGTAPLVAAVDSPLKHKLVLATDVLDSAGDVALFGDIYARTYGPGRRTVPKVGYSGAPIDVDGGVRRIERHARLGQDGTYVDTFAVAVGKVAAGPRRAARLDRLPRTTWIDFHGGAGTVRPVPFYDVIARKPSALRRLRHKIVVVGNASSAGGDFHDTSAPGNGRMNGSEIQVNAITTALDGFPLRSAGRGADLALIVLLGLLPLGLALRVQPVFIAVGGLLAAALYCVAAQLAFDSGRVVSVAYPLAAVFAATLATCAVRVIRR